MTIMKIPNEKQLCIVNERKKNLPSLIRQLVFDRISSTFTASENQIQCENNIAFNILTNFCRILTISFIES